jgi:hypothetical protein
VSETSIGKWKEHFLAGGRQGLEHGDRASRPTGREAQMVEQIDDLADADRLVFHRNRWRQRFEHLAVSPVTSRSVV